MAPKIIPPSQLIKSQVLPARAGTVTPDDICTVKDVCALLKVDRRVIYRAVEEGRLPVMRLGAKGHVWRFYKPDVLRLREGGAG